MQELTSAEKYAFVVLNDALDEVQNLPPLSQWGMVMELLPDDFFAIILVDQFREESDVEDFCLLLGLLVIKRYGRDIDDLVLIREAAQAISECCYGEMERRQRHYCKDVELMVYPFDYDEEYPIKYIPKEPETFRMDLLKMHYEMWAMQTITKRIPLQLEIP